MAINREKKMVKNIQKIFWVIFNNYISGVELLEWFSSIEASRIVFLFKINYWKNVTNKVGCVRT